MQLQTHYPKASECLEDYTRAPARLFYNVDPILRLRQRQRVRAEYRTHTNKIVVMERKEKNAFSDVCWVSVRERERDQDELLCVRRNKWRRWLRERERK